MTSKKIPYGRHHIDEDDIQAVVDILRGTQLTQGPKVEEFERAIAGYVEAKYAVAVSSGTTALHLACMAADVGAGDKVVTSPNTFVASANCALYVGASPEFADIDADTLNMSPAALAQRCASLGKVKAIIPVHFAGLPCDMVPIKNIADDYGAVVIEDASHALGATYPHGGRVGNCAHSDMTVFSFHPVKIIAAGEGGMITTNSEILYRRLLRLRSHGINKLDDLFVDQEKAYTNGEKNPWYYEMQELGFNSRITDIQCALGLSQFGKLDSFLSRRREIAAEYDHVLKGCPFLTQPQMSGRNNSANHLYVIRIDFDSLGMSRGDVMTKLLAADVGTQVHYIPVPYQPYYQNLGFRVGDFQVAEKYYREALSIPLYYGLSPEQKQKVIDSLKSLLNNN